MEINGKQIAKRILSNLKKQITKENIQPHLAIIIVGKNPQSKSYVRQKILKAKEVGIKTNLISLNSKTSEKELINKIIKLNKNNLINGIIVQKPLPGEIRNEKINLAISPLKDIDGFHPNSKFTPPIGLSVLEILKEMGIKKIADLKLKKIAILGKGETGGKPIKNIFLKHGINPIIIDSKTKEKEKIIKQADIAISAVGKKDVVTKKMLKKGVLLIGAGQHLKNNQFRGDYSEEEIKDIASFYTTTPGGIGPVNVSMLLKNLVDTC